ncbi:1076_t:CDS:1, partial [Cetraspora pellucida]
MESLDCSRCKVKKSLSEFMGVDAKGQAKQFRTCSSCRVKTTKSHAKKKKQLVVEEYEKNPNKLEIIEKDSLYDYILEILDTYLMQQGSNLETASPFFFQCQIEISTLEKPLKEITN